MGSQLRIATIQKKHYLYKKRANNSLNTARLIDIGLHDPVSKQTTSNNNNQVEPSRKRELSKRKLDLTLLDLTGNLIVAPTFATAVISE